MPNYQKMSIDNQIVTNEKTTLADCGSGGRGFEPHIPPKTTACKLALYKANYRLF